MIVRVPGDEPIVSRLRAELSSYRFRAIELADRPARRTEALSQLAEKSEAQAALRAKPDAMAIELWVRASGASTPSEELVSAGPGRDPEVLALRVTEAMRARGLTLPPLIAAGGASKPALEGGKRAGATATPPAAEAGIAEPLTLQPGDITEPVIKPPEAVKPAAPAKPPITAPEKPAEPQPQPAKPEAANKPPTPQPARPEVAKPVTPAPARPELAQPTPKAPAEEAEPAQKPAVELSVTEPSARTAESSFAGAREALLYVEVGPAGVLSPGPDRLGPALDLLVSFTFRPYPTSSLSLVGLIPLLSTDLTNNGASLDVRTYGIGGFGDLHLPLDRFELSAGLGALALISTLQGISLFVSEFPAQRLAALLGRVGASLSLTRDLRLNASIMAGLTVQQLRLELPRSSTAEPVRAVTWGEPLLFGSLSIELALPWDR